MGKNSCSRLEIYTKILPPNFGITIYDSCKLAEIEISNRAKEEINQQFIIGGIEKTINNQMSICSTSITVLAFSIGGTIIWKTILKGMLVQNLFCISSTRLRIEVEKPNCNLNLYFGENDAHKPNAN